jgi:undecaprenyl-diphosphatase
MGAAQGQRSAQRLLTSAILVAVAGCFLLVTTARFLTGRFDGLDGPVLRWLRNQTGDGGWMIALARDVTALGKDTTLWTISLGTMGYLVAGRSWRMLRHLVGATAIGAILTASLKALVDRPRPAVVAHLVEVHSWSFPSGHAMDSAFVYVTVALIAACHDPDATRRRYLVVAALALVAAIGFSRLILGVHWPTDVLAGWALGLSWAMIAARWFGGSNGPRTRMRTDLPATATPLLDGSASGR